MSDPQETLASAPAWRPPRPPAGDRPLVGITPQMARILGRMCEGKTNRQIGGELHLTEETVKTHARRLFRILGAHDRAHAVALASNVFDVRVIPRPGVPTTSATIVISCDDRRDMPCPACPPDGATLGPAAPYPPAS